MPHERRQFAVLYRDFLRRIIDLDLLSAHGDIGKLLGQLAAMLGALNCTFVLVIASKYLGGSARTNPTAVRGELDFLVSTTMAGAGMFAVLAWNAVLPDRRDAVILGLLPLRTRTVLAAKVAAIASVLGGAIFALNAFSGFAYPFLALPEGAGAVDALRSFAGYWFGMAAAGLFVCCGTFAVEGVAAWLLPHRWFLRVSSILQLGAFFTVVSAWLLQPPGEPRWLPSTWFFALQQALRGAGPYDALAVQAVRALVGACCLAAVAFAASYARGFRRVVEQPDILPASPRQHPRLAYAILRRPIDRAIVLFTARTVVRSRQHRLYLAAYVGIGLAVGFAYCRDLLYGSSDLYTRRMGLEWNQPDFPLLIAGLVLLCFAVAGARSIFSLPVALQANWVFRLTAVEAPAAYFSAVRNALAAVTALPLWVASAAVYFLIWPPRAAAQHVLVLGLAAVLLVHRSLDQFRKIPFACSYLPGKSNLHIRIGVYAAGWLTVASVLVQIEYFAMDRALAFTALGFVLLCAAAWSWRCWRQFAASPDNWLQFEDRPTADIEALDLHNAPSFTPRSLPPPSAGPSIRPRSILNLASAAEPPRVPLRAHAAQSFQTLEAWWQDLRFALRTLKNSPLVTATAIVALALGIGANTTVFTVVTSALHFDMGVDHIEGMVVLRPGEGLNNLDPSVQAPTDLLNLRGQIKTVENLAAYRFFAANVSDGHVLPERFWCVQMTPSGWSMVRQKPILGREFGPEDERADAAPTVLLTHKVWERRYGRDPEILGKAIRVNDVERLVIGVMPVGAQFPEDTDVWTPLTLLDLADPAVRRELLVFGRLAPGATLAAAQSEVDGVARRAIAGHVNGPVVRVQRFLELIGIYGVRPVLIAMVFAIGFVLLIVCADLANLLLARAAARAREISIRIAIGAGRARIIRQLLVESVLLATAGGIGGWLVALAGLRWFDAKSAQARRPSWMHFTMDAHAFVYLAAISIGAGILFGLAPALQLANLNVIAAIKDGGRGTQSPRGRKLTGLLVAFQMVLCVVLLAASGLMIHSTVKLYNAPLSVDASHVLTMRLDLPEAKYSSPDRVSAFYRELNAALARLPGVKDVTLGSDMPMLGFRHVRGQAQGSTVQPLGVITADENYFRTFAIRMLRGRAERDQAVVNESFAAKYWPGEDVIGKRVQVGGQSFTVSGVCADIQADVMRPLDRFGLVYVPHDSDPRASVYVMARTAIPPGNLIEAFRRTVQRLDANLPAQDVTSLSDRIALQRLNVSSFSLLFAIFAAVALALASVGLYAVVAQAVTRRTQEIGIRMAMGGTRRDIFGLVVKQGMRQVAWGFIAGMPLALLVSRVLNRLLVGVSPLDPVTYAGVALILGLAGFLGSAIPAVRAVRVDPLAALRYE